MNRILRPTLSIPELHCFAKVNVYPILVFIAFTLFSLNLNGQFVDRLLTSEADFSGNEEYINFDDISVSAPGYQFVGNEYSSQGINFSTTGEGMSIVAEGVSTCSFGISQSSPNYLGNYNSGSCPGPFGPITIDFDEIQNRIGFYLLSNSGDDVQVELICFMNGTQIGSEIFINGGIWTFSGIESVSGFDRVILTGIGTVNQAFNIDELRFEGGVTIENCPAEVVNLTSGDPTTCQATYSIPPILTSPSDATVSWYATGATIMGSPMSQLPISMLEMGTVFNYGLTQIYITATDGLTTDDCLVALVISEYPRVPVDFCADITVDLLGDCMEEVTLPDVVALANENCDIGVVDEIAFSWIQGGLQPTIILTHADLGTNTYSAYIQKYRDGVWFREVECVIQIDVIDTTVPSLTCPTNDITVQVAPTCSYIYTYDVESTAVVPCGGSLVQNLGDPSNTLLTAGTWPYSFDILDESGAVVESCSWSVFVEESPLAPAQLNCIGHLNVSIDQDCMGTIDATMLLAGSVCLDPGLLTLSATLPSGEVLSGATITFTEEHVGMDIDVTVTDPNGINSCWGTVTIEDKVAPAIMCPPDVTVLCTEPTDTSATGIPLLLGGMYMEEGATISNGNCEAELFYRDAVENNLCNGAYQQVITRTFYVVDAAGNMSEPCSQIISVERELLANASYPPHWDGLDSHLGINDNGVSSNPPLACEDEGVVWNPLTREDGRIVPSPFDSDDGELIGTGAPGDVGSCGTIFSFYEDIIFDICEGDCATYNPSFKVLRTWDVFDWCTGEFMLHEQIIKVLDTVPPVFTTEVPDLTVSTDLWGCGATIHLPEVEAMDQCSSDIHYWWSVTGGTYDPVSQSVYVSSEAITTPGFEIELTAYAEDCCGNISSSTGLVTIIDNVVPIVVADEHTVVTLNNQEGDGSTKVHASSFDDGSFDGCGPIDWWVRRMDKACENYDGDPDTEIDEINDFHKYIHFCCDDTEEDQMVVFMVCDDADRDGTPEMNGDDNCNSVMILVDVQDKLAPTIVCPAPVTINCIDFVAFEDYMGQTYNMDDESHADAIEFLNAQFGNAYSNSTCGEVTSQTFAGSDFCGEGTATRTFTVTSSTGTATCVQTISIIAEAENVLTCDRISFPTLSIAPYNYNWCDPEDAVSPFVSPVVVDGCGSVNIESPVIDIDNLCTEVGMNLTLDTFNFAEGGCWKILAHWEVIDQCLFEENFLDETGEDEINPFVNENGYYEIYVEYDIFDSEPPELICDDVTVATSDCDYNYDSFSISASDACTPDDIIAITYKVDVDGDGLYDYPADGSYAEGNSFDASVIGGFGIGSHGIKWVAYDGCGNYSICHQHIEVEKQAKEPTPYCHLGLSSAVMDSIYGCAVEIWAVDFVAGGFDDCDDDLTYLMIPYQDIYGDPADETDDLSVADALDMASDRWTLDCDYIENGEAHVVEIRIYAVDADGRYDFCDASLTLNDNFDCCEDIFGGASLIAGNVATEEGIMLEDVEVNVMSNGPEFPRIQATSSAGSYMFNALPYEKNYEVSAYNNKETKAGVSTLDLVLIQRHILGITTLESPYRIIAADINGNEAVSASDLLQLRKLILGLFPNDELPSNSSWRFVDNKFNFTDITKPFPFDEVVDVNDLSHAMYNQNFVAVKVGDVNGSVSASLNNASTVRNANSFNLNVLDANFAEGQTVTIDFTVSEVSSIYGFQLGLDYNTNALTFNSVQSSTIDLNAENIAVNAGVIKTSWNSSDISALNSDDVLFSITFSAINNGTISEALSISNKTLQSEAYDENLTAEDINITFRTVEVGGFELLQNEPNPFNNNTSISFVLPEAGNANLKVYDVTGKVILVKNQDFIKGINTVILAKEELGVSGVLYYQLTYGSNSATRKMILLD
jgi:hypothetical protein